LPNSRTTGRIISESAAERDTGIDHRVVSRWRKGLADVDAYRLRMTARLIDRRSERFGVSRFAFHP